MALAIFRRELFLKSKSKSLRKKEVSGGFSAA